jgi:hypothetical protein
MAEFRNRELHLVKKALCIAVLAIEQQPGPFQSASDMADMKTLLDDLIPSDVNWPITRAPRISLLPAGRTKLMGCRRAEFLERDLALFTPRPPPSDHPGRMPREKARRAVGL